MRIVLVALPVAPTIAPPIALTVALTVALTSALTTIACGGGGIVSEDAAPSNPDPQGIYEINRELDILFVVDNSGSMREEQENLAREFPRLINDLELISGGLPDLHLGVISTDTGIGLADVVFCSAQGDDGVLQNLGSGICAGLDDPFIFHRVVDGTVVSNAPGPLEDTFACLAQLGTMGCGFESPLEALKRALDPAAARNPGFLRDRASLAVVFLTDEDDCSASSSDVFLNPNATVDDPLGPLSSFRCFDFGVECDPDDPRTFGFKRGCGVRAGSSFFPQARAFIDFINELKGPGRIVPIGIYGQPRASVGGGFDAEVVPNPATGQLAGTPDVAPSCMSASGDAVPAIRLRSFLDGFSTSIETSICDQDLGLSAISGRIDEVLSLACMVPTASDPACVVTRTATTGASTDVEQCAGTGATDCYTFIASDTLCGDGPALRYSPPADAAPGTTVRFDCGAL